MKDNDHRSTNLISYPQNALLDFGSTLAGIDRRLSQHLFIHNHTEQDLNVKIDRMYFDSKVKLFRSILNNLLELFISVLLLVRMIESRKVLN